MDFSCQNHHYSYIRKKTYNSSMSSSCSNNVIDDNDDDDSSIIIIADDNDNDNDDDNMIMHVVEPLSSPSTLEEQSQKPTPMPTSEHDDEFVIKTPPEPPKTTQVELLEACRDGDIERVRGILLLYDAVVDINAKYDAKLHGKVTGNTYWDGSTALMEAANNGHRNLVEFLVTNAGADVNLSNNSGTTALMYAATWGHRAIVRFLTTKAGAFVNKKNQRGETALMQASRRGHGALAAFLIEQAGANVHDMDDYCNTALSLAGNGYGVQLEAKKNTVKVLQRNGAKL